MGKAGIPENAWALLSETATRRVRALVCLAKCLAVGMRYDIATCTAVVKLEIGDLHFEVWADGTIWLPDYERSMKEILTLAGQLVQIDAALEAGENGF